MCVNNTWNKDDAIEIYILYVITTRERTREREKEKLYKKREKNQYFWLLELTSICINAKAHEHIHIHRAPSQFVVKVTKPEGVICVCERESVRPRKDEYVFN